MRVLALAIALVAAQLVAADTADGIFEISAINGGLVVHLGCGDGRLTTELHKSDAFLVCGLDRDAAKIAAARKRIVDLGLHGKIIVEHWTGKTLPLNDNLVNLVVVDDPGTVPMAEILRVLCPNGVALTRQSGGWKKTVKPRPNDIDEWTHFLHDASNNAVANDRKIAPPKHLQWTAGPMFTRDHDSLASVSAMTSSNGRIFYILDEGETSEIHRPSKWKLIARDAFNGKLLWKRDISRWITQLANFRAGPAQLPRRLVSTGDRVFVTLGLDAPVVMLDAVTGKTLRTFQGTEKTEELIIHQGTLLTVVGDPNVLTDATTKVIGFWQIEAKDVPPVKRRVVAFDIQSGARKWTADDNATGGYIGLSLTALGDRIFYLDGDNLQCRNLSTGKQLWKSEFAFKGAFLLNYTPTVVAHDDVILCLTYKRLCAYSIATGKKLWEKQGSTGFASAGDLFVIDDLVWTMPMVRFGAAVVWNKKNFIGDGGKESWGLDLHSGEIKKRVSRAILPGVHHHRCYRNKASSKYIIYGQGGLEFQDVNGTNHSGNLWTRGICQYGVMPANGYIYIPPHPCQCYSQDLLKGFYVLSADNSNRDWAPHPRLVKGPAAADAVARSANPAPAAMKPSMIWQPPVPLGKADEWPIYRHDITRSGAAGCRLPDAPKPAWQVKLGADLTAATVAGSRVYLSSKAEQILYCLDAASGRKLWQLATPGQVDSPPTLVNGLCVFGSRDGRVYCLNAADGALRWRLDVCSERRTVVDDQIESVWPIHGSVLVMNNTVYFAAGRSSHLDGGIRIFAADLATGAVRKHIILSSNAAGAEKVYAMMDLLESDGKLINMGLAQFDPDLNRRPKTQLKTLICDTGFLHDAWFHRENWVLGGVNGDVGKIARTTMQTQSRNNTTRVGKLMAFNDRAAYGIKNPYSWQKYYKRVPTHTGHPHQKYSRYKSEWFPVGCRIFSIANGAPAPAKAAPPSKKSSKKRKPGRSKAPRRISFETGHGEAWGVDMPWQPRTIALAGNKLVLAGWLDAIEIQPKTGLPLHPDNPDPRNSVLRILDTNGGKVLSELKIPAQPAFDGIAVAYNRIYLPLKDGTVMCLK